LEINQGYTTMHGQPNSEIIFHLLSCVIPYSTALLPPFLFLSPLPCLPPCLFQTRTLQTKFTRSVC